MTSTVFGIAVDCANAEVVARFWAAVLDRQVAPGATAANAVLLPADSPNRGPRMSFHQVPEAKATKNRLHLDLITTNFDTETERLAALGARRLGDVTGGAARWTTVADIEGNEFDLIVG